MSRNLMSLEDLLRHSPLKRPSISLHSNINLLHHAFAAILLLVLGAV